MVPAQVAVAHMAMAASKQNCIDEIINESIERIESTSIAECKMDIPADVATKDALDVAEGAHGHAEAAEDASRGQCRLSHRALPLDHCNDRRGQWVCDRAARGVRRAAWYARNVRR